MDNTKIRVSLREAGDILGFSYPTMLELAHRPDFPAFKCKMEWTGFLCPGSQSIMYMPGKSYDMMLLPEAVYGGNNPV